MVMKQKLDRGSRWLGWFATMVAAAVAQPGCAGGSEEDDTSCPAPQAACGGACVDTASSVLHCGACDNACPAGVPCFGGQCGCPAGTTLCAGECVSTAINPGNCGSCGVQCKEHEVCESGVCQCPGGQAACTSGCADLMTDKMNCGQCNVPCAPAQSCAGGACVCPDGKELCFSECVDTMSDANHCGNCTTACGAGAHCKEGECESISGCGEVSMDTYEANETCPVAHELPDAAEGGAAVKVNDATLHHTDQSLDTDWFAILATEGSHLCFPSSEQCYFVFDIAFTPPDAAAYQSYQLCVSPDDCGSNPICTTASDWNAQAGRYELSLSWPGTCGLSDDAELFVKIARSGGVESCEQYGLEYQMSYTDEECP